jgi:hypothetical protein
MEAMFWIASGLCLCGTMKSKQFPQYWFFKGPYGQLIGSLFYFNEQPLLREATLLNVFSFAQFGAYGLRWFYCFLVNRFNFNSATIGLFNIGASGSSGSSLW